MLEKVIPHTHIGKLVISHHLTKLVISHTKPYQKSEKTYKQLKIAKVQNDQTRKRSHFVNTASTHA